MYILSTVIQGILGLGFIMFGLSKFNSKMVEEFKRYRLPQWFRIITGIVELVGAGLLISGVWNANHAALGALILAGTMLGAILTHIVRVGDPVSKAFPSIVLFFLTLIVLLLNFGALFN